MKKFAWVTLTASLLVALVVGCEQKVEVAQQRGRVAVIDLNKVFKAMDWDKAINDGIKADKDDMEKSLAQVRAAIMAQVEQLRKNVAEKAGLNEEQTKALATTNVTNAAEMEKLNLPKEIRDEYVRSLVVADRTWQAQLQQHNQVLNNRLNLMMANYRNVVKPVADQVAQQGGFDLVLFPSDTLVYFSPAADISNDVIVELKKINPTIPPLPPATQPSLSSPAKP